MWPLYRKFAIKLPPPGTKLPTYNKPPFSGKESLLAPTPLH